ELRHVNKTLTFTAHTFDWWIPVRPLPGESDTATLKPAHGAASAGAKVHFPLGIPPAIFSSGLNGETPTLKDSLDPSKVALGLGWEDGAQRWQGQHREIA